ncbi:MAG: ABC transporter permease [Acidobacteria bacterium]|nr:ABC transporter permease [Acidobacteriota bacterium]
MRNRRLLLRLAALGALHMTVLFAGFIAPRDPGHQDRELAYAPPTRLHFIDSAGFCWRPFVYAWVPDGNGYREDSTRRFFLQPLVRGDDYKLLGCVRSNLHLFGVKAPAQVSLLGRDAYGRDEFSRLLMGGQISLAAGLLATLVTLGTATLIGSVSGYFGRWIDEVLMGGGEFFLSLPWFYFLVAVRAFLPLHLSSTWTFFLLISVIGVVGWARPARLVRGVVLSARQRNYVLAARGFGASDFYLLRKHILPATYGVLLTQAALLVPQYVAAEATLSFFGLGISDGIPSWGNMLSALREYNLLISYWWLMAPACGLFVTSVMYWLLADALHHWLQSHSI